VLTDVTTSTGNPDYVQFDPDDPSLSQVNFDFDIEDHGPDVAPEKYAKIERRFSVEKGEEAYEEEV
jgi:hypothetical protein